MWSVLGNLAAPGAGAGRLTILIYHRVLPAPDPMYPEDLDTNAFGAQMEMLARHFNVLPLAQAVPMLEHKRLPPRAVCISFDDGYADNAEIALPILRRHGLHATFFVATGFLDGGRMWNDSIIEAVRAAPGEAIDLAVLGLGRFPIGGPAQRRAAAESLVNTLKYQPLQQRLESVDAIVARIDARRPGDLMMRSQQVRDLHEAGMGIGGHTVHHPILASVDMATARAEIIQGRERLEEIIGARVTLFAYPNGQPHKDYEVSHARLVQQLGFDAAVSTATGAARLGGDRYQLPRLAPWREAPWRFALRLLMNYRSPAALAV